MFDKTKEYKLYFLIKRYILSFRNFHLWCSLTFLCQFPCPVWLLLTTATVRSLTLDCLPLCWHFSIKSLVHSLKHMAAASRFMPTLSSLCCLYLQPYLLQFTLKYDLFSLFRDTHIFSCHTLILGHLTTMIMSISSEVQYSFLNESDSIPCIIQYVHRSLSTILKASTSIMNNLLQIHACVQWSLNIKRFTDNFHPKG